MYSSPTYLREWEQAADLLGHTVATPIILYLRERARADATLIKFLKKEWREINKIEMWPKLDFYSTNTKKRNVCKRNGCLACVS
jgi:hypothetical protein